MTRRVWDVPTMGHLLLSEGLDEVFGHEWSAGLGGAVLCCAGAGPPAMAAAGGVRRARAAVMTGSGPGRARAAVVAGGVRRAPGAAVMAVMAVMTGWGRAPAAAAVLLLCCLGASAAADSTRTAQFDVRPGGLVHSHSETLGDHSCIFTYASQGGTNERWHMSVGISEDNKLFSCSIWRPQGKSYLFFTQFKAEITNAKIEFANAFSEGALGGGSDVPLKENEYVIHENTVTHKDELFKSQLSKLIIVARSGHDEL